MQTTDWTAQAIEPGPHPSRLDTLINTLCPDGVEYKSLTEIFDVRNGYTPSKNKPEYWEDGTIPWFRMEDIRENGRILSDSMQHINMCAVKGELFPKNSIIVSTSATIGEHALITVPSLSNQRFDCLTVKASYQSRYNIKFIYYYCFLLDTYCIKHVHQGNFQTVDKTAFNKFQFPLPPLAVQEEIVRILDKFSDLTDTLRTEQAMREKQYAYYRDKLLTFPPKGEGTPNPNPTTKLDRLLADLCPDGVEYVKLGDTFTRLKGTSITARKMQEIKDPNGEIKIFAGGQTRINANLEDIPNANITYVPAVLVQSRGVIDFIYYDKPFTFKNEMWAYTSPNQITVKYLYYVLTTHVKNLRYKASNMGSMPQISISATDNLSIPLPPLAVQEEIVRILDKFDTLTHDLTEGLPAEIEAREKQYTYYRDKLLTFPKKTA